VAPELARLGRIPEAEALLAPLELDCYPCLIARGEVAAAKGDPATARRWLAEAAWQGPSLPYAHEALGRLLVAVGDHAGAEAAFAEAARIQPRWADPLKHHGDLLARSGHHERAARLYQKAARHAPRWGALHIAWGQVLWRAGQQENARAKFRAAAAMGLSPADTVRLRRLAAEAQSLAPSVPST
jgi:Tfp pilus assembly protein PilF